MLYRLIQIVARWALLLFCCRLRVHPAAILRQKGPLLLAVNHPNSFLDAVILGALFRHPIHFLARGDAFHQPLARRILGLLHAIPVYRLSEGKTNLGLNEASFEACLKIFRRNGIVLIFSEGICVNEWKLRPLRKGTARLALRAWQDPQIGDRLKVIPVGINYHSFRQFGKQVILQLGAPLTREAIYSDGAGGVHVVRRFNEKLLTALQALVLSMEGQAAEAISGFQLAFANVPVLCGSENMAALQACAMRLRQVSLPAALTKKINGSGRLAWNVWQQAGAAMVTVGLLLPALIGGLLHAPFFIPIQKFVLKKTTHTVFYDSVLFAVLFLLYPIYLLLGVIVTAVITHSWWSLTWVFLLPFCAWCYLQWKESVTALLNGMSIANMERKRLQAFLAGTSIT